MNSAKLNDWLQVLGLFGVMASLLFVGLQMKQTQEIARSEAYSSRAGITIGAFSSVMGTPQYDSGMAKIWSGLRDALTAEEYLAIDHYMVVQLTIWENIHYQYVTGFIPAAHWKKNLAELDCHMSEPILRELARFFSARDDFGEVVRQSIARGEAATQNCWISSPEKPWPYFNSVQASVEPGTPKA